MACRCAVQKWQRDREKQRELAKKAAVLLDEPQVLYRMPDGTYCFVGEGGEIKGEIEEIITQY